MIADRERGGGRNRGRTLLWAGLPRLLSGVLLVLLAQAGCSQLPEPRRSLIVISMDTLRADRLGAYGYARSTSPNIDALAARGARFARAHSPAPWTLPSHASIFTGLTPQRHATHSWGDKIPSSVPTLAELLRGAGWRTFGHTTGGFVSGRYGFARGFEEYVDELSGFKMTLNAARRKIESLPEGEPYFLFLQTFTVHCPYPASSAHRATFRRQPESVVIEMASPCTVRPLESNFSEAQKKLFSDRYDAAIRSADEKLADFVEFLDRRGEFKDTYLVLLSDHGDEFGEHDGIFHGHTLYEELLHVPLIIVGPGVEPSVIEEQVGLVDLMQTALDLLQVDIEAGEGRSLTRYLGGDFPSSAPARAPVAYFASTEEGTKLRGVSLGDDKLILDLETGQAQLFDLGTDPGEKRDIAAERPSTRDRLRRVLDRHLERTDLGEGGGQALSPEQIEELEALGYVH
ncbi:MAG: sulfatase-like hydrolase/transferase [Myxococcota bacterium]|nr:sulfatase-like hydrolase/transferase [Myxococcota bacterium]